MRERNLRIVKPIYEAYAKGDPKPFFDALSPEVAFRLCAPEPAFPFAGPRRGPAAVRAAIAQIAAAYEWIDFRARGFVAQGDYVIAFTGGRIRHRASGVMMDLDIADVIRLDDGHIVEFSEFFDSAGLLAWQAGAPVPSQGSPLGARFMELATAGAAGVAEATAAPPADRTAIVRGIYAAYARHDPTPFFDCLCDDASYNSNARDEDFSFAASCHGKDVVKANLARIAQDYALERYDVREIVVDGPWVVVLGNAAFRHRATGRLVEVEKVDAMRFRGDRIADFFEFFDTASSLTQIGVPLAAPPAASASPPR